MEVSDPLPLPLGRYRAVRSYAQIEKESLALVYGMSLPPVLVWTFHCCDRSSTIDNHLESEKRISLSSSSQIAEVGYNPGMIWSFDVHKIMGMPMESRNYHSQAFTLRVKPKF